MYYVYNGDPLAPNKNNNQKVVQEQAVWRSYVKISNFLRGQMSKGASGARSPNLKSLPPISRLAPGCYIHPIGYCNFKLWPPSGFWPLFLFFATPCC